MKKMATTLTTMARRSTMKRVTMISVPVLLLVSVVAPRVTEAQRFNPGETAYLTKKCQRSMSAGQIFKCAAAQVRDDCLTIRDAAGHSSWTNAEAKPDLETAKKKANECMAKFVPTPYTDDVREKDFKAGLPILTDAERAYKTAREKGTAARGGAVVGQGGDRSPLMQRAHSVLNRDRTKYKTLISRMRALWVDLKKQIEKQRQIIDELRRSLQATIWHQAVIQVTIKWADTIDTLIKMTDLAVGILTDIKGVHADMKAVGESVQKGEWKADNLQEKGEGAKKTWEKAIEGAKKMGGDASEFVTLLEKIEKSTQTEATGLGASGDELDGLMKATDTLIEKLKGEVKKKWIDPFVDDLKKAAEGAFESALKTVVEEMKKLHLVQIPGFIAKQDWKRIVSALKDDAKKKVKEVVEKHQKKLKEAVEKFAKEKGKFSVRKIGKGMLGLAKVEEMKDVLMKTHRFWAARRVEELRDNETILQHLVDDAFATDRNLHIMYRMVNNVVWSLEFHAAVLKKMGLDI